MAGVVARGHCEACCRRVTASALPAHPSLDGRAAIAGSGWFKPLQDRAQASRRSQRRRAQPRGMEVKALDAAMPFDFEHKASATLDRANRLTVGIVGFGTFGQFLAKRLVQAGHQVLATSRQDYSEAAAATGVEFFADVDDFCEEHPDVVVLATSILSLEAVMRSLPVQRLRRNTLFVDVLSVKEFPKRLLLSLLPAEVDILCTHPMFGPDSGSGSWANLNLMHERVRIGHGEGRRRRADLFLQFFEGQGCKMVEMGCAEHDQLAASTQFITHTVGRVLGAMDLQASEIDTRGYQSLLDLVDNTTNDSFDLYYGLFMYNKSATEELERLEHAFDSVKKQLFDRLHGILREQLFHDGPAVSAAGVPVAAPSVPQKAARSQAGSSHTSTDVLVNGAPVRTL